MNIIEALDALSAREQLLTDENKAELDDKGYMLLPGVIGNEWLETLRGRFEDLCETEGTAAGLETEQESGTRRLADLVNKGPAFDGIYTHPKVQAAVHHVIGGELKLSSLNGRAALPGEGHQKLHTDWSRDYDGRFHVCNSVWLLDDFTEENGCTRLVPGTHRARCPSSVLDDPMALHPEEQLLVAPAGTVGVFNSHTWHGGTLNRTVDQKRRAVHCYFIEREGQQQLNQRDHIRSETWGRISQAARYILDVDVE